MGFLSNLTPNLEKFSAFGEIASLKKHYEKFTIKNTPLYSDLGEYRGGILIRGVFLIGIVLIGSDLARPQVFLPAAPF